ncbi:uncharacterized protein [Haliotis cracherodii]|uniref:uncharacterized protein n=1 Tax=Haliotis cracherodii TaxID=6455 RepID=UPI0039E996D9
MSSKSDNANDRAIDENSSTSTNEAGDGKDMRIPSILDNNSCHESTDDATSICSEGLFLEEVYYTPSTSTPQALSPSDPWAEQSPGFTNGYPGVPPTVNSRAIPPGRDTPELKITESELKSLVVADGQESARLRELIGQVVLEHEVHAYRHEETFDACNNNVYQLIWMKMTVPANQETLSLSTSIRYASKSNRGTIILGIADIQPDVDLRLHGIDEVLVGPLSKTIVRQKYMKWTSVQTVHVDDPNLLTPECPKTPTTPSSACSDTVTSNLNASQDLNLSTSPEPRVTAQSSSGSEMSSNLPSVTTNATPTSKHGSPGTPSTVLSSLRNFNLQSVTYQPRPARPTMASSADHTTKEKLRRERIKDSCDQLRVLLPYIRGRKTDMASILEMTVDYLKIVNAAIPADFQNQVITLMSKGAVLPKIKTDGGRGSARRSGRREPDPPESPSTTRVSSTMDTSGRSEGSNMASGSSMFDMGIPHSHSPMSTPTRATQAQMTMAGGKRESTDSFKDIKSGSKRMHISPLPMTSPTTTQSSQGLIYMQSDTDGRTDANDPNRDTSSPLHLQGVHIQSHIYGDLDSNANRMYPNTFLSPDNYPISTPVGNAAARMSNLERDAYGMYVENAFYQYYGQPTSTASYNANSLSDYVNPNAVLPVGPQRY